jgi:hypothetical protein
VRGCHGISILNKRGGTHKLITAINGSHERVFLIICGRPTNNSDISCQAARLNHTCQGQGQGQGGRSEEEEEKEKRKSFKVLSRSHNISAFVRLSIIQLVSICLNLSTCQNVLSDWILKKKVENLLDTNQKRRQTSQRATLATSISIIIIIIMMMMMI